MLSDKFYDEVCNGIKIEECKNMFDMLDDIKKYCSENDGHVIPFDFYRELKLGFLHYESKKCWKIRAVSVKNAITKNIEDEMKNKQDFIRRAVQSEEGKLNLCSVLCGKNCIEFMKQLEAQYKE